MISWLKLIIILMIGWVIHAARDDQSQHSVVSRVPVPHGGHKGSFTALAAFSHHAEAAHLSAKSNKWAAQSSSPSNGASGHLRRG